MKDILGNQRMSDIMTFAMRIVLFALIIELVGGLLIYQSLSHSGAFDYRIFASVFHAISAFCNAGFTLTSHNLMQEGLQQNYYLQWIIMILIIFGGLGYGIASNFIHYVKNFLINIFRKGGDKIFLSRIITLNTKMVVYTTLILIFAGAGILLLTEQDTILASHHSVFGEFTTAMFASVTTRTAGFNTFDPGLISVPGLLIMILLMWIGASPSSTGGGIKTTTFALASLNVFSLARGKDNIEMGTRRVPKKAVQKAFAIIIISLIAIGISIFMISVLDPEFSLMEVAFECFSAYSTVGLSLGITGGLSMGSKYVVIFLMLFGRVGLMNLMIGIMKKRRTSQYQYPKENITIT